MWILHQVYSILHSVLAFDGARTFAVVACAMGAVYLLVSSLLACELGRTTAERLLLLSLQLSAGAVSLFFGYVEVYPFPFVFGQFAAYLLVLAIRRRLAVPWALGGIAVAVALHLSNVMLVPAAMVLLYFRARERFALLKRPWVIAGLAVTVMSAAFPLIRSHVLPACLPLEPGGDNRFGVLSLTHLSEFYNSQVLAFGPAVLLVLAGAVLVVGRLWRVDPEEWLLLSLLVFPVGGCFVFDPILGAMDWDVLSLPAFTGLMAGVVLALRSGVFTRMPTAPQSHLLLATVAAGLIQASSWVTVNATDLSIARTRDVVLSDPGAYYTTHPPEMALSTLYGLNGLGREGIEMLYRARLRYPGDGRTWYNLALALFENGRVEEAEKVATEAVAEFPVYGMPYRLLTRIFEQRAQIGSPKPVGMVTQLVLLYLQTPRQIGPHFSPAEWKAMMAAVAAEAARDSAYAASPVYQRILELSTRTDMTGKADSEH